MESKAEDWVGVGCGVEIINTLLAAGSSSQPSPTLCPFCPGSSFSLVTKHSVLYIPLGPTVRRPAAQIPSVPVCHDIKAVAKVTSRELIPTLK